MKMSRKTYKRIGLILSGCFLLVTIGLGQQCNALSAQEDQTMKSRERQEPAEFKTAKTTDESWDAYLDRLIESDFITKADKRKWLKGKVLTIEKELNVTRFRAVLRTGMINVRRSRIEKRDGKQIEVPYTEQHAQPYAVSVPIAESVRAVLNLPAKGSLPEDAEFEGFVDSKGERIATRAARPTEAELKEFELEMLKATPQRRSRKLADENWQSSIKYDYKK